MDVKKNKRFLCDEGFFNRETEAAFYWAGFIMADGCMHEPKKYSDGGVRGKKLTIDLGILDKQHLEKFKSDVQFQGSIREHFIHGTERKAVQLGLRSDMIFDGLIRFGVVPRKSKSSKIAQWVVEHKLFNHFLRGLFDGDGCIHIDKRQSHPQMVFSLVGTEDVIAQCLKIFGELTEIPKAPRKTRGSYVFSYTGNFSCSVIRDFLYKDATIFLERKREKFFSVEAKIQGRKLLAYNPDTGESIVFDGIKQASILGGFCRSGISQCLNGERELHRGWRFQDLEEASNGNGPA